jgi:hypothetical protein
MVGKIIFLPYGQACSRARPDRHSRLAPNCALAAMRYQWMSSGIAENQCTLSLIGDYRSYGAPKGRWSKIYLSIVSRSREIMQTRWGPSAVPIGVNTVTGEAALRRRSRQAVPRPKVIQFSLTQDEFNIISDAAASAGLARGAFAAEVTLAAACGMQSRSASPLREALAELMAAAGLVRRIGTNLNQAVARLNATDEPGPDLLPSAQFCVRVIRRLDEAAEQVRRAIP